MTFSNKNQNTMAMWGTKNIVERTEDVVFLLGNMQRQRNTSRKHLRSVKKLATGKGKKNLTPTWELCFFLLGNMATRKTVTRKHLRSAKKLATEKEK